LPPAQTMAGRAYCPAGLGCERFGGTAQGDLRVWSRRRVNVKALGHRPLPHRARAHRVGVDGRDATAQRSALCPQGQGPQKRDRRFRYWLFVAEISDDLSCLAAEACTGIRFPRGGGLSQGRRRSRRHSPCQRTRHRGHRRGRRDRSTNALPHGRRLPSSPRLLLQQAGAGSPDDRAVAPWHHQNRRACEKQIQRSLEHDPEKLQTFRTKSYVKDQDIERNRDSTQMDFVLARLKTSVTLRDESVDPAAIAFGWPRTATDRLFVSRRRRWG